MEFTCKLQTPVGLVTLASDGEHLTGLWLEGQKYYAATLDEASEERALPVFEQTKLWLDRYFAGEHPAVDLPLAPKGSEFRHQVWQILLEIPYGSLTTYGEIAKRISAQRGMPAPAQAIGGAVGHNPISIIIPCHRVVGTNGNLTGYAGGLDVKKQLLGLEGVKVDELPRKRGGLAFWGAYLG